MTGSLDEKEKAAVEAASNAQTGSDLSLLFGICGRTDFSRNSDGFDIDDAAVFKAALTLCPDHPKLAELNKAISVGDAAAAEAKAIEEDTEAGKFVGPGKYLLGAKMVPGQWQSQGSQVADCYWEISDAQGNIMDNNFISIAPQFTIYVPASASGFTAQNCSFRWIGE